MIVGLHRKSLVYPHIDKHSFVPRFLAWKLRLSSGKQEVARRLFFFGSTKLPLISTLSRSGKIKLTYWSERSLLVVPLGLKNLSVKRVIGIVCNLNYENQKKYRSSFFYRLVSVVSIRKRSGPNETTIAGMSTNAPFSPQKFYEVIRTKCIRGISWVTIQKAFICCAVQAADKLLRQFLIFAHEYRWASRWVQKAESRSYHRLDMHAPEGHRWGSAKLVNVDCI